MTPEAMRKVAMERLRERARRIGVIRRSVIAGAVATFVLAWGLALSDQLAHGTNADQGEAAAATSSDSGSASFFGDDESEDDDDDDESDDSIAVSPTPTTVAPSPAPLTTSQS